MTAVPSLLRQEDQLRRAQGRAPKRIGKIRVQKFPKIAERTYRTSLLSLTDALQKDVEERLLPMLPAIERSVNLRTDTRMDVSPHVEQIEGAFAELDRLARSFQEQQQLEASALVLAQEVARFGRLETFRQFKAVLGLDLFVAEPQLLDMTADFVNENVTLIESIPTDFHNRISRIVRDEFRQGARAESVQEKIRDVFSVTRNRAILIARDQSNKLNGQLTRMRQTNLGIESYRWRTSKDERVRASHRDKEGRIFQWSEPPSDTGHPGQDINCRCTAEPNFDDLLG